MLKLVEYPICINPDAELKKVAEEKGWVVVNENTILDKIKNILPS